MLDDQVRRVLPSEDKLIAAMAFFDKHPNIFHFLLTPNRLDSANLFSEQLQQVIEIRVLLASTRTHSVQLTVRRKII